jgi:hypothetical protein
MTELNFTEMGAYNAVRFVGEPEDLLEMFRPDNPGEKYGRLEDVETAIQFIQESMDSDTFTLIGQDDQYTYEFVADQLLRGYILETIRFRILREDWEPMFDPFPNPDTIMEYAEPDVRVYRHHSGGVGIHIDMRSLPNGTELTDDPHTFFVHDVRYSDSREEDFWVDAFGHTVRGDDLEQVLSNWFTQLEDHATEEFLEELGPKLNRAIDQATYYIKQEDNE